MGRIALLLFVALPIAEIYALVQFGSHFGALPTLGALFVAFCLGLLVIKTQGFRTIKAVQRALANGRIPDVELISGLMTILAGVLFIAPGLITDALGVVLLLPPVRTIVVRIARSRFAARFRIANLGGADFAGSPFSESDSDDTVPPNGDRGSAPRTRPAPPIIDID